MSSTHLSNRKNWQAHANVVGTKGEVDFANIKKVAKDIVGIV